MTYAQAMRALPRFAAAMPRLRVLRIRPLFRKYCYIGICAFTLGAAHIETHANGSAMTVADYRNYLPESHPVPQALQLLAHAVTQTGMHTLTVIANPLTGSPRAQIQALQDNAPQAPTLMLAAASGLAEIDPSFAWFDTPYAIKDVLQAEQFYASEQAQTMLQRLHQHGLHGLAWLENGFRIITADRPFSGLQALKELRIRTVPIPQSQQLFEALNAQPVSLPAKQVLTAMHAGQLPAQESFVTQVLQQNLQRYHRHLWLTQHTYGAQVLLMPLVQWQQLPPQVQHHLQTQATKVAQNQRQQMRQFDQQALAQLAAQGMQLEQPSEALMQTLYDATHHLREPHQAAP